MKNKIVFLNTALTLIWFSGVTGFFIISKTWDEAYLELKTFGFFSALFLLNLFFLFKILQSAFQLMKGDKNTAHIVDIFVYGTLKIFCLIFILFILFSRIHTMPLQGFFLSLGTMIVLPLLYGLVWSQNELKKNK